MAGKNIVVLGASDKADRYSYKAIKMLEENGYNIIPVHPVLKEIDGIPVKNSLSDIKDEIYTLTLYIAPERVVPLIPEIIALKPQRVVLNPGTESDDLKDALTKAKIPYLESCTLVLLRTGQFEKAF